MEWNMPLLGQLAKMEWKMPLLGQLAKMEWNTCRFSANWLRNAASQPIG
jgi:hypothetical protein